MKATRKLHLVLALGLLGPLLAALLGGAIHRKQNQNNLRIISSGVEREILLVVPDDLDPAMPVPLVVTFHGGGLWPAAQRELDGWHELAEEHGFLLAYPSGTRTLDLKPRRWRVMEPGTELDEDVRFVEDLLETLQTRYKIDPDRVYANGLSNGGAMAFALSCRLSTRFAAVGLVAPAQMLPLDWCPTENPVPGIVFAGTQDKLVPYRGGSTWVWHQPFASIPAWTDSWALRNRCGDFDERERSPDVTLRSYRACAEPVLLYTIEGGGHTWPGGSPTAEWFLGRTTESISATSEMWDFFSQHRQASP